MPFQKGNKEYLKIKPMTEEQRKHRSEINSGKNNPFYGRRRTDDEKRRISLALKGRKKSPETIAKIAKAITGKKKTEEENERNRQNTIRHFSNPENREIARINALRQWADEDKKREWAMANKERVSRPEVKTKISDSIKNLWKDENYRLNQIKKHTGQDGWNKGRKKTPEEIENMKKAINRPEVLQKKKEKSKALWLKDEYIKKLQEGLHIKPNRPETILLNLLNALYPGEWKYSGDLSFIINGKCPDFVNCNGQKKVIELFGDYWHRGQKPEDRKKIFAPFGYETLVIWEKELKDIDSLKRKIIEFSEPQNKVLHTFCIYEVLK